MSSLQPAIPLTAWQQTTLPLLRALPPPAPACSNQVTAVFYHTWADDRFHDLLYAMESAFRMTWLYCGHIRSCVVTNRLTPALSSFCEANDVAISMDAALPGGSRGLSMDCIQRLHQRFQTDYVLLLHADGFPLRKGLPAFVGPYDYIGAPWMPPSWYTRMVFPYPRFCVGNGGLCLRSRHICERAAWHYERHYKRIPYCYLLVDDVFYARVLPRFERDYRNQMRFAPPEIAASFAFEANEALLGKTVGLPFGFHSAPGFLRLQTLFPDASFIPAK